MALYMADENYRLVCKKCGSKTFYEKPVYGFLKRGNDLRGTLSKTLIVCSKCDEIAHEVIPNKGTIIR